jgi:hypothetical protein
MNYDAGEAAIEAVIQGLGDYDSSNVARGDWSLLNAPKAVNSAILVQDQPSVGEMYGMGGAKQYTHYTRVELYRLLKANPVETTYTDHLAAVETMVNQLEKYRHLNDSTVCTDADVISISEPKRKWLNDGGPIYIATDIVVEWIENIDITYSD